MGDAWVKRNRQHLSLRACKALADKRAGPEVLDGGQGLLRQARDVLGDALVHPSGVFNYDETRISQRGGNLAVKRVKADGKDRANALLTQKSTVATLLSFISASGSVLLSVYVMKANFGESTSAPVDFCLQDAPRTSRRCWPRYYCWTETGYLNAEPFQAVVGRFSEEWTTLNPGVPALFFGDQLGVHRRPDVVERALDNGVYLFFLPKNTSHITQPLDEAPFGTCQRLVATGTQQGVIDGMLRNEGTRNALLEAACTSQRRAFTPRVIIGAFRRCGLWPFAPQRMLAQVADALGVGHTNQSTRGVAAAAAGDVIKEAASRAKAAKKRTSMGSAVVERARRVAKAEPRYCRQQGV
eukprot:TRINITY_DN4185_c0_g1_i1.p1 TRINITY_DN4185_c0_g1~~TRINITY_DN4185_c0_g1_i1.p1  ORF type:complete len:400 (-),score=16.56 TRINITY_DN4185_c0_g1_i1:389-1453(-)